MPKNVDDSFLRRRQRQLLEGGRRERDRVPRMAQELFLSLWKTSEGVDDVDMLTALLLAQRALHQLLASRHGVRGTLAITRQATARALHEYEIGGLSIERNDGDGD